MLRRLTFSTNGREAGIAVAVHSAPNNYRTIMYDAAKVMLTRYKETGARIQLPQGATPREGAENGADCVARCQPLQQNLGCVTVS